MYRGRPWTALGQVREAPAPVQAFVDRGVDFVTAKSLPELVYAMNTVPDVVPLDLATVEAEVTARDREVANRFTKDTQITAIRSAILLCVFSAISRILTST